MHLTQRYQLSRLSKYFVVLGVMSLFSAMVLTFIFLIRTSLHIMNFLCERIGGIYMRMVIVCLATAAWMAFKGKAILWPQLQLGDLLLFKLFVPEI